MSAAKVLKARPWTSMTRGILAVALLTVMAVAITSCTSPSTTPTPTPTPVNCGGSQGNFTIRDLDIPPSQLTVSVKVYGHQDSSRQAAATRTTIDLAFFCDGNTVQFPARAKITCNGGEATYQTVLLGPAFYEAEIAAVPTGNSYTCQYTQVNGASFAIPITAMPAMKITAPTENDLVPIPKTAPLSIQYVAGGNPRYFVSGTVTDGNHSFTDLSSAEDSGAYAFILQPSTRDFAPGHGTIELSREFGGGNYHLSGTSFASVTLDYSESSVIDVLWTTSGS
jgi:hypothetical protein